MPPGLAEGELDAIALEEIVVTGVADGTVERRWVATDPEDAEARVGPILVLPGARIAGTERSADGGAVRTLQLLPGDVEVQVVQSASMPAGDTVIVAAEEDVSADREVRTAAGPARVERAMAGADAAVPEPRTVTVTRDGTTLVLTGRLPPELLRALATHAAAADGG